MIDEKRYNQMKEALTDKIVSTENMHMDDLRIMYACVKREIETGRNDMELVYSLVLELIQKYKDKH